MQLINSRQPGCLMTDAIPGSRADTSTVERSDMPCGGHHTRTLAHTVSTRNSKRAFSPVLSSLPVASTHLYRAHRHDSRKLSFPSHPIFQSYSYPTTSAQSLSACLLLRYLTNTHMPGSVHLQMNKIYKSLKSLFS
jgi:hypothetical protein